MPRDLADVAAQLFGEALVPPPMSLRGGNAADSYAEAPPFEPALDEPTDAYLEANYWGLAHLDAASWRHYVPRLIAYALAHKADGGSMVVDSFIASLRPPDREPQRFGALSTEQEAVLVAFLDALAFDSDSAWSTAASVPLEEYWAPGALYRPERGSGDR